MYRVTHMITNQFWKIVEIVDSSMSLQLMQLFHMRSNEMSKFSKIVVYNIHKSIYSNQ